jgi:hypothetical protein
MHATSMPEVGDRRKMRDSAAPNENAAGVSRETEPRPGACGRDAGGMLCIDTSLLRGKQRLSQVELALLSYISDHPIEQGSRKTIAEACDCAPNSIPRAAKKLEARGIIERTNGGGSAHTAYKITRNPYVTTHNTEVTRNPEDTTPETSTLRAIDGVAQTETNTSAGVVTAVTGGRNMPPLEPPNNTNSLVEANHQPPEPSFEGGLGELFDADRSASKPRRQSKRRPKREKFYASEDTMPLEPNEAMSDYAAERHLLNGERAIQFGKFRRYHISNRTLIASLEQRWETWVDNWAKSNRPVSANGVPKGFRFAGVGADGHPRYVKDQRSNVYR